MKMKNIHRLRLSKLYWTVEKKTIIEKAHDDLKKNKQRKRVRKIRVGKTDR
jgi:hypothetical protein